MARLASEAYHGQLRRLDLNMLVCKHRGLKLSQIHVLVEPVNVPEAEAWVNTIISHAYGGERYPYRFLRLAV